MTPKLIFDRTRGGGARRRGTGYVMIELAIVIALSTLLAVWKAPQQVREVEDAGMDAVGVYMQVLNSAVEKYNLSNHNALSNSQPVAGFVNSMAPTIEELRTAKYISNPSFPTAITKQNIPVAIKIIPQNCPGVNCQLFGVSYATQAMTFGTNNVRYDLVARFLQAAGGSGASAPYTNGGNLVSSIFNVPNPNGNVPGTIAIGTYLDEGLYQRFVQIRDTRDPDLQGNLSVAGNLNIGGSSQFGGPVTVNNTLSTTGDVDVNKCIRLQKDGRAGFNCFDPMEMPSGWDGGVRTWDVAATGSVLTTEDPKGWSGPNTPGKWSVMSRDSEAYMQTSGRMVGNRLIPSGLFTPGSACSDAGAVARSTDTGSGGMLVVCSGSAWAPLVSISSVGAGCSTNGAAGVTPGGVSLTCVGNQWMSAVDREGKWSVQDSIVVMNGWNIGKPGCGSGGVPKIFSIPQAIDTRGNASNFTASDQGSYWNISLTDGTGAGVSSQSLAQIGCWYQ
ncbi:hypothetical protein [Variovorax gossypii]